MTINKNTCPAFYLDATIDPVGSYSPCTALGGGAFKFPNSTFKSIWMSPVIEESRQQSKDGIKLDICKRCWSEESIGFTSQRNYLTRSLPESNIDFTELAYYESGPRHLNIKVSNICNLRCRTCQSKDSYLYHIEGEYYEKKNNISRSPYTIEKFKKIFSDEQLDELYEFSENVERIELYGGEPFLDDQIPKYLLRLVESGASKQIELRVSTNATHKLTDTWRTILTNFNNVILNISIDGIGKQFTYLRHPGDWNSVSNNLEDFFKLEHNTNITIQPVITVSALNVWNVQDVFEYFSKYNVTPFIILVQWPNYYCVNVFPDNIKPIIESHLRSFNNPNFDAIINLMNTTPSNYHKTSESPWHEFKFWTKEKDEYRKENFVEIFDDLGNILINHNHW